MYFTHTSFITQTSMREQLKGCHLSLLTLSSLLPPFDVWPQ